MGGTPRGRPAAARVVRHVCQRDVAARVLARLHTATALPEPVRAAAVADQLTEHEPPPATRLAAEAPTGRSDRDEFDDVTDGHC